VQVLPKKEELVRLIDQGPAAADFTSACWRSPMIQQLIFDRFGVFYNVFYIAQLLKDLGFSWQKAAFVSDHLDEANRRDWRGYIWPKALRLGSPALRLHVSG
jgi:transposase